MKKILLFFILFQVIPVFAQNNPMQKALDAYKSKDFNRALTLYDSLINRGYYSKALYYNLGNTYYNMDSLGKAMLYFEKALKLDPHNKNIQHNIFLTRRKMDSEIVELPDFFLKRWWNGFAGFLSLNAWTFLSLLFTVLYIINMFLYWFYPHNKIKSVIKKLFIPLLFLLVVSLSAGANVKKRIYNNNSTILIKPDSVFIAPDFRSEKMYELNPGEKMYILDSLKDWYKVELLNKEKVWIKKNNFKKI
jgi:tetratricopeptide (TPR) repeat protein